MRPVLIGIAGGSGSGKTWLARRVCQLVGPGVGLIETDQYFRTELSGDVRHVNFDHPSHIDIGQLVSDLGQVRAGLPVLLPRYDFLDRSQTPRADELGTCRVVLVEGLFVLSAPIVDLIDFSCFLDVENDQRLLGRLLRDLHHRRATVAETIDRYQRFVRPSYDIFVAPTKHNADVVIDFTFRRAYFTELLANMVGDVVERGLDVEAFLAAVHGDTYRLGYRLDEPVMPPTIDIRDLARVYPERTLQREPMLTGDSASPPPNPPSQLALPGTEGAPRG